MSKRQQVVGSMSKWSGMFKDFFRQIDDCSITAVQFEKFLEHKNPFGINLDQILGYWFKFYKDQFSVQPTFSDLVIPEPQKEDINWHIITMEEVTEQVIFDRCKDENKKRHFPCWKWTEQSLDDVLKPDKTSKGIHIGLFRNRQEADEELKNLSANMLEEQKITGTTLRQREIMELDYYLRTGKYLDIYNWTLCTGSRYVDGNIPSVNWNSDKMNVSWYSPDNRSDFLRSRQQFYFS